MTIARATTVACALLFPVFCASANPTYDRHKPSPAGPPPSCEQIAQRIVGGREVLAATSVITPAAGTTPAYCQVNLTQAPTINIRVGLPLSAADGGTGGVNGAWLGKVQNLGVGGFGGTVGSVAGPVRIGYVGSATDTGHSRAWCNAINPATGWPNSQRDCGLSDGGFVLDPRNNLLEWQVKTYMEDSILQQTEWALKLTKLYYGRNAERNYWTGCSGGGRQGLELAQNHAELFDGFLIGAPAINFNRFIVGQSWVPVVVNDMLGAGGLPPAKSAAATKAAIAACDANDGVVDGLINEPRRCNFDANALRCTGRPSDPATCLSQREADAINAIWAGPSNPRGERLWGALPRGASFDTLLPGGNGIPAIVETWGKNWLHQDPAFDSRSVNMSNFASEFEASYKKFRRTAATDDDNLDGVRKRGAKIIHYHGAGDPLTLTFGSYTYVTRLFDRYGVQTTQNFMRSFYYPAVNHCGGGDAPQPDTAKLFDVLQNWVEKGVAPDHVVAQQTLAGGAVRTRKICKYPDEVRYDGSGSTDDESNFRCVVHRQEPSDLAAASRTNKDRHGGHGHGRHDHGGRDHDD
jgi:feruloyl esterase